VINTVFPARASPVTPSRTVGVVKVLKYDGSVERDTVGFSAGISAGGMEV
jgi:hypothetical protein